MHDFKQYSNHFAEGTKMRKKILKNYFQNIYNFRISMETAGLPIPGYHYIAPNHIVKAPIH